LVVVAGAVGALASAVTAVVHCKGKEERGGEEEWEKGRMKERERVKEGEKG
jgi:hypothetical protein